MSAAAHDTTRWIYQGIWRVVVRWFRVPEAPPSLPAGAGDRVRSFRPSNGFLRYLKLEFWILLMLGGAILTGLWIALIIIEPFIGLLVTPLALAVLVLPGIVAYVAVHLQYDATWYVLSDRSMRIRRGIWTIRETTLTYSNVQNVKWCRDHCSDTLGSRTLSWRRPVGEAVATRNTAAARAPTWAKS